MDNAHRLRALPSVVAVEVPGYDVLQLLGFGAVGEVWRARDPSGDVVALKRLRGGADPAGLRREAAMLGRVDTPYLVRLREVLEVDGAPVLVLDYAGGGSLARLLTRRDVLTPGEVVTLGVPLAEALAATHAAGIAHGDVSAAKVLLTLDGMPLLSDFGVSRLVGAPCQPGEQVEATADCLDPAVARGGGASPVSDVWALGAVLHRALAGCAPQGEGSDAEVLGSARVGERTPLGLLAPTAPRALIEAVEAALADDPAVRPDASSLAGALRRSCPATPLGLVQPDAVEAPPRPAGLAAPDPTGRSPARPAGRLPLRLLVAGGVTVVLVVAAGVGWASGRSAPATAPLPAAGPTAALPGVAALPGALGPVDWQRELDGVDAARAAAFAAADPALLAAADAPGSPAMTADRAALASLQARGWAARGVRHRLLEVTTVLQSAQGALLRVVDERLAVTTVDGTGRVVAALALRSRASYDVELVRVPAGWRLARVAPRSTGP